ncbi:MAG: hypothetical protein ACOX6Q_01935 [Candidatus Dojkabacteria bacterium]|jgi:hypothetical protein
MDNKNNNNTLEEKQFFIDSISRFCDKCGTAYTPDDVNIVQNTGATTIIHFSCSNCKARHIATFVRTLGLSQRVPLNTDLGVDEIKAFSEMEEISLQEILNMYTILKKSSATKI